MIKHGSLAGFGLCAVDMPDVDLVVRNGGDKRLSNFLLWQSAYACLFVVDNYWSALSRQDIEAESDRRMVVDLKVEGNRGRRLRRADFEGFLRIDGPSTKQRDFDVRQTLTLEPGREQSDSEQGSQARRQPWE